MTSPGPERSPIPAPPPLDLPALWWGPMGRRSTPLTIHDLIANQTLSAELAAWLWLLIEEGASTLVCAGPGGAGKTTLLTALTAFLPRNRTTYVVRGAYDSLDAIAERSMPETTLLLNEISAHLPIYVWGPGARRAFDAGLAGAQLLGTAHANSPDEVVRELSAPPIHATDVDVRLWDLVLFIDAWRLANQVVRRVVGVVSLSLGAAPVSLAASDTGPSIGPVSSQLMRVARRYGRQDATIDTEVRRRMAALSLVP